MGFRIVKFDVENEVPIRGTDGFCRPLMLSGKGVALARYPGRGRGIRPRDEARG